MTAVEIETVELPPILEFSEELETVLESGPSNRQVALEQAVALVGPRELSMAELAGLAGDVVPRLLAVADLFVAWLDGPEEGDD